MPVSPTIEALLTPFSEAMSADDENVVTAEAIEALLAEFEDEEFELALEALTDEAAARHLRSIGTWSRESEAPVLATSEVEQWIESVATEADRVLGELERHFGDRPADSLREGEMEAVSGVADLTGLGLMGPAGAQEQFIGKLVSKARKVVEGVANVAKKGLAAVSKVLPIGILMRIIRKLVRPLLRRALRRPKLLPPGLRPIAGRLAGRFEAETEVPADEEDAPEEILAEMFDRQVAELVLAPNEAIVEHLLAEAAAVDGELGQAPAPVHDLDLARARLASELANASQGEPPTAQMEQFIPAVMAALPVIRMGIRIVGRERVVKLVARALANLIKGMVGAQAATLLSRHIASTGLQAIGLEAENGTEPALEASTLGTEALVASAEDTIREVLSLPTESLEDELLLEAEVQDAFSRAAIRHLPAAVLKTELVEGESADEHAVWVMMPRATRPCFRYKKYSRIVPVRITRPVARWVAMSGGDTLERRLLDAGVQSWPVAGELELYELLAGAELGHIAAFESESAQDGPVVSEEYEELSEAAAALLAGNPNLAATGRHGRPGPPRRVGSRYYRLRVGRAALRRRRLFSMRLDLASARPVLQVFLFVGERTSLSLASHLERRMMVQVVSIVRGLVGPAMRQAMALRLERMLGRRGVTLAPGAGRRLAEQLADAIVRAVSQHLPAAGPSLAQAAKDPAPGVTLAFGFTFPSKAALGAAAPNTPTLTIRPGSLVAELVEHRQTAAELAHWRLAVEALADLDAVAAPNAWAALEQYLQQRVRDRLRRVVEALIAEAQAIQRMLDGGQDLAEVRNALLRLRGRYLQVETVLDFYGDAVNSRTSPRLGTLLRGYDTLAGDSMAATLNRVGIDAPLALVYQDKGLGAAILRAGIRLWDRAHPSPAAAIKLTRHNLSYPTALLHETGHQVGHLTGWNAELAAALGQRLAVRSRELAEIWQGWSSEVAADVHAFAQSGWAPVAALANVVDGTTDGVYRIRYGDPHPFPFIRVLFNVAMCRSWYGAGPWDVIAAAWSQRHHPETVGGDAGALTRASLAALDDIVEVCTRQPMAAFGGSPLAAVLDPRRVSPAALDSLARQAGPSLLTSSYLRRREPLRILAVLATRAVLDPERASEHRARLLAWVSDLGAEGAAAPLIRSRAA